MAEANRPVAGDARSRSEQTRRPGRESIWGVEDRPYMKRPEDRSIRMPVGSWFFHRRR
jgi:hypothetical protein